MKRNQKLIAFLAFSILISFAAPSASAQKKMIQPGEFFQDFPGIRWGMSVEAAKKAIEKNGLRAVRPIETEIAWQNKFEGEMARGYAMNRNGKGIDQIGVVIYHSESGKRIYEKWSKKLIDNQGEPHESESVEDVTSKVWRFKDGFAVEIRLVKATEKLHLVDLRWVKLSEQQARLE